MVSKTRKQMQKRKALILENGCRPTVTPSKPKSIHLKKTRPNMKGKKKIRLGLESPIDVYDHFEDRGGVKWRCPTCEKTCRVVGFCVDCATGVRVAAAKAAISASLKTKLRMKKKR